MSAPKTGPRAATGRQKQVDASAPICEDAGTPMVDVSEILQRAREGGYFDAAAEHWLATPSRSPEEARAFADARRLAVDLVGGAPIVEPFSVRVGGIALRLDDSAWQDHLTHRARFNFPEDR